MLSLPGLACTLLVLGVSQTVEPEVASTGSSTRANVHLERALEAIDALQYGEALGALDEAWQVEGNDRETVIEIVKLQGLVASTLNQAGRAQAWFGILLYLEPNFVLTVDEWGPRPFRLFAEIKAVTGPEDVLRFEADTSKPGTARVVLPQDRLGLVQSVRFHHRAAGVAVESSSNWSMQTVAVSGGAASLEFTTGIENEWFAELLGERERVLARSGSPSAPLRSGASAAAVAQAFVAGPAKKVEGHRPFAAFAPPFSQRQWGGVALAAGGLVTLGAGGVFGAQSASARETIDTAARDAQGRVTGLTRSEALALDRRMRGQAVAANILFGAGVALAGAGVGLFFTSPNATVGVSAAPGAVAMSGSF